MTASVPEQRYLALRADRPNQLAPLTDPRLADPAGLLTGNGSTAGLSDMAAWSS